MLFRRPGDGLSPTWFLLGVVLVLWFPGRTLAAPSILVLAAADPAASVVGCHGGTRPLGKDSLEGPAAFFLGAAAVLIPFVGILTALPAAAVGTPVEAFTTRLDDNVVIPVVTAVCLPVSGLTRGHLGFLPHPLADSPFPVWARGKLRRLLPEERRALRVPWRGRARAPTCGCAASSATFRAIRWDGPAPFIEPGTELSRPGLGLVKACVVSGTAVLAGDTTAEKRIHVNV